MENSHELYFDIPKSRSFLRQWKVVEGREFLWDRDFRRKYTSRIIYYEGGNALESLCLSR
jgi:hypothetical protein